MVDATIDAIIRNLREGNEVQVSGFASFSIQEFEAKAGYSPLTKAKYSAPARKLVKVKASKNLRYASYERSK